MCNIQIYNHAKRYNKLEENVKKAYAMIFKEFCSSQIKSIIKEHPKYDSILKDTLNLMDEISQSMHETIRSTYSYL